MGLLAKQQYEVLTDRLAARVAAAAVTPAASMLSGNTEEGLAAYIDEASSDPDLQAALLPSAVTIDRQMLGGGVYSYINQAIANSEWAALISALNSYVQSGAGGGYASLAAYLDDVGATTHPLAAEIIKKSIGANAFGLGGAAVSAMHPRMQTVAFDRVYAGTIGSLIDETIDAGDVDTADVACFAADDDIIALGSRFKFSTVLLELSQVASTDCDLHAFYWNGSAWAELVLTDYTSGFSVNGGMIGFDKPADWVPSNMDMDTPASVLDTDHEEELYYVILQRQAVTVSPSTPELTWLQCVPSAIANARGRLYGLDQPPIALVRVTGSDACEISVIRQPQYEEFICPGTANGELRLKAITSFSEDVTFTLGYTGQDGNAATNAQSTWSAPIAAGDTHTIALAGGDTGLRAISASTCAVGTDATSGVFSVEVGGYARAIAAK